MGDAAHPIRVLVVDDEFVIALDLSVQLVEAGYEVSGPVGSSASALVLIEASPPDLALLDVNLSGGDTSYDIARSLAARHIPFAFVSGYSAGQIASEFRYAPLLAKPCPMDDIVRVIEKMKGDPSAEPPPPEVKAF